MSRDRKRRRVLFVIGGDLELADVLMLRLGRVRSKLKVVLAVYSDGGRD